MIDEAGGTANVFGHSSGAVLALEAARLLPVLATWIIRSENRAFENNPPGDRPCVERGNRAVQRF